MLYFLVSVQMFSAGELILIGFWLRQVVAQLIMVRNQISSFAYNQIASANKHKSTTSNHMASANNHLDFPNNQIASAAPAPLKI